MIILALCMLTMIIFVSREIHSYSQETYTAAGRLEKIESCSKAALALYIGGNRYLVSTPYPGRSFGVPGSIKRGKLRSTWENKIGAECTLEYLELNSGGKQIVQLTIDGFVFVHKEAALDDLIGSNKTVLSIAITILALALVCCILVRKGIIK